MGRRCALYASEPVLRAYETGKYDEQLTVGSSPRLHIAINDRPIRGDNMADHGSNAPIDHPIQEILGVINNLATKSAGDNYIYRGEPRHHNKVSSGLYRKYCSIATEDFDFEVVQTEMLEQSKEFIKRSSANDDEILHQLQHFGAATNLIDFTTDNHIALFFACDGEPEEDGRVILLNKANYPWTEPTSPAHRVIAQKSVFVQSPKGFIEPNHIINVPQALKGHMLGHLAQAHGISAASIYNDLYGFIRYDKTHESAYAAFYEGRMHYEKGEYDAAIQRFTKSIKLNGRQPASYVSRGHAYQKLNESSLAIRDYTAAINLNPYFAIAYSERGAAYLSIGENDLALLDLNRSIGLDPNSASAFTNRGNIYLSTGDYHLAIQDHTSGIGLDSNYPEIYNNRAVAYTRKGDYDRALLDLNKAISLNPRLISAYTNRGDVYLSTGKYDLAIQDYTTGIALDPRSATAFKQRGAAYMCKGRSELALQDLTKAVELDPTRVINYVNRAAAYGSLGYHHNATLDLTKAIELDPQSVEAYTNRAISYMNQQRHDLAIQDCNAIIQLNPDSASTFYYRSRCWLYLKDWKKVESDLSVAQKLGFDVVAAFREEFGSVKDFERKYKVRLPTSVAQILTGP